ncbi:MAG: cell wall-binding repeat-containing protein [Coriobacteriia bacterium]
MRRVRLRQSILGAILVTLVCGGVPAPAAAFEPYVGVTQSKVTAFTSSYSGFGSSTAAWDDVVFVGAPGDDRAGTDSGVAYWFLRVGDTWAYRGDILGSGTDSSNEFGNAIAIFGDTALIGSWGDDEAGIRAGAVYVYMRSGDAWHESAKLTGNDAAAYDRFGGSVAIQGDVALIGAATEGAGPGAVYVFTRSGDTWSQSAKLAATDGAVRDYFGAAVALDGDTALIAAPGDDTAAGVDAGSAYVFTGSGSTWSEQAKLTPDGAAAYDIFGGSVALDGGTALIGATYADTAAGADAGEAYVFTGAGTQWTEVARLTPGDGATQDQFACSVALSGGTALVGSHFADTVGGADAGAAYLFTGAGAFWSQRHTSTAADGAAGDRFGDSVALCGGVAVVGSPGDDYFEGTHRGSAYIQTYRALLSPEVARIAGADRYLTAIEASKRGFIAGAPVAVVATGANWPDALGGSALAGAAHGPIVLARPDALPGAVAAEIERLGVVRAYVIGGTGAVSAAVEAQLRSMLGQDQVTRLGGSDRYATARLVADETIRLSRSAYTGRAFFATGVDYPDAVAASPLSAAWCAPIVLVNPIMGAYSLPSAVEEAVILGGEAVVSGEVEESLESALGTGTVTRLGGVNRYATAALVAQWGVDHGLEWRACAIATGQDFPDALAAGPMVTQNDGVLLLTLPGALPSYAMERLVSNAPRISTVFLMGGTGAIADAVEADVHVALGR